MDGKVLNRICYGESYWPLYCIHEIADTTLRYLPTCGDCFVHYFAVQMPWHFLLTSPHGSFVVVSVPASSIVIAHRDASGEVRTMP